MYRYCFLYVVLFLLANSSVVAQSHSSQSAVAEAQILENFENEFINALPSAWYDRDGNDKLINYGPEIAGSFHYKVVEEDGNKFLRYEGTEAKHINYPLINKEEINIYETPVLTWKVRAHSLPENGNENVNESNDSVASVYVVFDFGHVLFKRVPKSIRYTWSTTLPEGTELSKFFGNQKIVVVESGGDKAGQWVTFKRNILEDYKRLFGDKPPKKPLAILLLSDGDSTGSYVKADYDDIKLLPGK
jgi:hypothetical protein